MGAGHQGGSSSAEDGEIRKRFSSTKGATAKDARDFFRDRDSGLTANMAYLDSQAAGSGGQSNRDLLERQLGNQGLVLEGQNFVQYDEQGNRSTAGGINQRGNFWGSADLSGVNSPSYLGQNARDTGSRDRRYGSNADAMSQGTLASKIQNSVFDGVTYNPTGTVTGMNSQQVFNPTSLFSGDPNRTYNTNTGLYETDESIGFDDSSPSILGRMARGLTDYIGGGGIMGALSTDSGSGDTPEIIDMNLGGVDPMRPVLRPTDGSTTKNNGIMNSIYKGINYARDNPVPTDLPQYAGGYTGNGTNNAFLSSAQRGQPNAFINPAPQFNAQGVQVPFDGGNRIDVPLGIGTLPGKKTLSELAETERVRTAGFSGFRNPTNVFDPQQRIIDEAMRPLGDRVSMYEDDPSIAFGFGGEPFDLSEGSVDLSETSGKAQLPTPFGNSLGVSVEEMNNQRRFDRGLAPTNISDPQSEATYIDPTDAYQTPFQRDFTYLGGNDGLLPRRSTSEINRIGVPTQIAPYDASFEREDAVRALPTPSLPRFVQQETFDIENQQRADREASLGGADQFYPPYTSNPIFDRIEEKDFGMYGSMEDELANSTMKKPPFNVDQAEFRPNMQIDPLNRFEGPNQERILKQAEMLRKEGQTATSDDADQLEGLITTGAIQAPPSQPYGSLFANQRAADAARDFYTGEGGMGTQLSETPAFDPSVPYSPNPIIARADEKNYSADLTPGIRQAAIDRNARVNAAAQRGILIDQLERADVERSAFPNAPSTVSDGMTQAANREASLGGADAGPMSIGDAFKNIGGDLKRIFNEDPAVVARREAAERDENMYGTGMFDLSETYDPSGANNMNMTDDNVNMTDAFKYIGGDIRDIFKESYNNAQTGVNESIPERIPYGGLSLEGFSEFDTLSPSSVSASQNGFNPANIGEPAENTIAKVIADARTDRLAKLGTATGFENNMPLEQEGPLVERDSRIRDAMAPDGLDDNMYNDGSEIFDLSETYNPSGGGFTDGGGGGGGSGGCPEGYEPMTLANGETVCVPIEEEVTEEEVEEETPVTPTVRPAMGPSAYTPQAVSPIRPYTLQPGEQGVGGLADILQLQNYPNIV